MTDSTAVGTRPTKIMYAAEATAHGERVGTCALIEVLLPARHMDHEQVVAGLAAAYRAGALTADAVALEARKLAESDGDPIPWHTVDL
ncbi:hypothetical protein ACIF80_17055 [Streptomyces sp. NPDC085927]|uniref:hypothetical protein n=1 Tax=Streptomyces sp. NPDC085927 TaxID=3365738 RepID=UPI0037CE54F9